MKLDDYSSLSVLFESGLDPKRLTEFSLDDSVDNFRVAEEALVVFNRLLAFLAEAENLKKFTFHVDSDGLPMDRFAFIFRNFNFLGGKCLGEKITFYIFLELNLDTVSWSHIVWNKFYFIFGPFVFRRSKKISITGNSVLRRFLTRPCRI